VGFCPAIIGHTWSWFGFIEGEVVSLTPTVHGLAETESGDAITGG
jgi:hypothetical protein